MNINSTSALAEGADITEAVVILNSNYQSESPVAIQTHSTPLPESKSKFRVSRSLLVDGSISKIPKVTIGSDVGQKAPIETAQPPMERMEDEVDSSTIDSTSGASLIPSSSVNFVNSGENQFSKRGIYVDPNTSQLTGNGNVQITVEGQQIQIFKRELNSSPLLKALFECYPNHNRFNVQNMSFTAFGAVLEFMLTERLSYLEQPNSPLLTSPIISQFIDSLTSVQQNAAILLEAAAKFGLNNLKNICEQILSSAINHESVIGLLIVAHKYYALQLRKVAVDFIKNEYPIVVGTDDFRRLRKEDPDYAESLAREIATNSKDNVK